ncbi:MAG: glutamate racemase [Bianqueaceae bacterium]
MDARPIGVFDSGVGGLTVVSQMRRMLPGESIVYFGDLARLPYGSKSKQSIIQFSHQIMRLLGQDVKAVIIACGTASSNSLRRCGPATPFPSWAWWNLGPMRRPTRREISGSV